jgi:hypothetical protein
MFSVLFNPEAFGLTGGIFKHPFMLLSLKRTG